MSAETLEVMLICTERLSDSEAEQVGSDASYLQKVGSAGVQWKVSRT